MIQDAFAQPVHPTILQMAQERPLPPGFETRADLVRWLGEQASTARTIVADYAVASDKPGFTGQASRMLENAEKNLAYFEGELIAHRAILETEGTAEE